MYMSKQMKTEEHLLPQGPMELLKQMLLGRSLVIFYDGQIIGHASMWPLLDNWYELGTVWVHPDYRHHGIGKIVFSEIVKAHKTRQFMLTTTNPIIMKLSHENGLHNASFWQLPQSVHQATCVCSSTKTGTDNNMICQIKDKKCQAFHN